MAEGAETRGTAGRLQTLEISRLGHEGDGLSDGVFVPYTLPGETVVAEVDSGRGRLVEVTMPSPQRVGPVCRHFGQCGGCALQHATGELYRRWKTELLERALAQHGITIPLQPMVRAPLGSRRRAVMGAKRSAAGIVLGFHEARDHRILDIVECPILSPAVVQRLDGLRALADVLLPRIGAKGARRINVEGLRIIATAADNGIDVVVEGAQAGPGPTEKEDIARVAKAAGLLRVCLDRDPIYVASQPLVRFGTVDVTPPPGVFLQAVPEIERAMAAQVVTAVAAAKPRAKRIADLFSGLGTFTFPLAAVGEVHAVDSDRRALLELEAAARRASGLKPVTAKLRDLHREPLSPKELEGFDAVVFDPPRAGAMEQAARIGRSGAQTVVAVSCAPGTLARDLAILIEAGFEIESVTPYDQFLYSAHVETVAVLRRARPRKRG